MKATAMQELMQWMEETEFMVNKGFIEKVNRFAFGSAGTPDNVLGSAISPEEKSVIMKGYQMQGGPKEKEKFIRDNLQPGRFDQISQGVGKELPKLNNDFNIDKLNDREKKIQEEIKSKEAEKKTLEDSQKKTESSAKSFEVGAAAIQTAAELFAKGTVQNVNAKVAVDVAGVNFVSTPQANQEIEALVKRLYIRFEEESKGITPVLAPTATA
jgi:hypothetical protein